MNATVAQALNGKKSRRVGTATWADGTTMEVVARRSAGAEGEQGLVTLALRDATGCESHPTSSHMLDPVCHVLRRFQVYCGGSVRMYPLQRYTAGPLRLNRTPRKPLRMWPWVHSIQREAQAGNWGLVENHRRTLLASLARRHSTAAVLRHERWLNVILCRAELYAECAHG